MSRVEFNINLLIRLAYAICLVIIFALTPTNAAEVNPLGARKIGLLKNFIRGNSLKKWNVYKETISMYVMPLSIRLLTESGVFKLQSIGQESFLVPNQKYFSGAISKPDSINIVRQTHEVIFDLLIGEMIQNFSDRYEGMSENEFLGVGGYLNQGIVEGTPRPLTLQDFGNIGELDFSCFQTLQVPYQQSDVEQAIFMLSYLKKTLGDKPSETLSQFTDILQVVKHRSRVEMEESVGLNFIPTLLADDWLVDLGADVIKHRIPGVLSAKAPDFIQYLTLYQVSKNDAYVEPTIFLETNASEKITKLAQALRDNIKGGEKAFLEQAFDHIEKTFNDIKGKARDSGKTNTEKHFIEVNLEKDLIALFEQNEDIRGHANPDMQQPQLSSYLDSLRGQINSGEQFKDQILIVMYYFDRMLPQIMAAKLTANDLPDSEVFSNLCAFIGRFSHCKTGQAASIGEMVSSLRKAATDLAKAEWEDFSIQSEGDTNVNALTYIKNVVNDEVQQVKERFFRETFVQETHSESSGVLLRRNLELCSFLGLPEGSTETWYDRMGQSAWDKVHPVLQAMSFYLLKLDPKDFSKVFDNSLRHWLPGDIEAELRGVLAKAQDGKR